MNPDLLNLSARSPQCQIFFRLVVRYLKLLRASPHKAPSKAKKRAHLLKSFLLRKGKLPPKPPTDMPSQLTVRIGSCAHPKAINANRDRITFRPLRSSLDLGVQQLAGWGRSGYRT